MGAQESALKKPVNGLEIGEEYSKKSNAFKVWTHINPCTINKKIKGTLFTRELQVDDGEIVKRLESGVKVEISHNNISPSSIFVCENGEWKLGGFEFARSFENDSSAVKKDLYKASKLPSCSTLEEKAREYFILNILLSILLRVEYEKNTFYRYSISSFMDYFCFKIELSFFKMILKLFSGLLCRLRSLPQHVISRRLSRLLLSRYVLLEPRSHEELYPELLIPAGFISIELLLCGAYYFGCYSMRKVDMVFYLLNYFKLISYLSCYVSSVLVLVSLLGTEKVCPWKAVKNFVDGTPIVRSPNHNLSSSQLNCLNIPQSATVIPSYKRQEFETIKHADDHSAEKCQRTDSEKNNTKEYQNTSLWNDESWSSDWEKREENCQCDNEDVANINIAKSPVCSLEAPTVSQVKRTSSNMIGELRVALIYQLWIYLCHPKIITGSEFTISVIKPVFIRITTTLMIHCIYSFYFH
uniref:SH3 domain-containing protein n=1 Tax=Heterorhabditis bacteriophora TaxID=37862 RepID=A0A1I7WZQ7_HETBA